MKALTLATAMMLLTGTACSYLRWHEPYGAAYPAVRELRAGSTDASGSGRGLSACTPYEYRRIVYADFEAPFWYVVYRPFQANLKRVLVLAGAQGDAIAGVEYLLDLVRILAAATPDSVAYDMDILPIVNRGLCLQSAR